jgi:ABC-type transport system involved in multi-copper enzyme maturation permease subunit
MGGNLQLNKLGVGLGVILLLAALGAAPMPLVTTFSNPTRSVTIYPNLLFAVPLLLLSVLLILYGVTAEKKGEY